MANIKRQITKSQRKRSIKAIYKACEYFSEKGEKYGSGSKLATLLGLPPQSIYAWRMDPDKKGAFIIPIHQAKKIELLTKGEVPLTELRADLFEWKVWNKIILMYNEGVFVIL